MLTGPVPMSAFAAEIRRAMAAHHGGAAPHPLEDRQWRAVAALAREKYHSWDWNVGRSPKFRIRRSGRFGVRAFEMVITVEKGRVQAVDGRVGTPDPAAIRLLARSLVGRRYRKDDMAMAFSEGGLDRIFRSASPLAFAELVTPI
jgi:lipoate-protein ligase A